MKKTPLYDRHLALGAKMAPFGGYEMPIQYKKGIIAEHHATRQGATVFDTCHMGEFTFEGSGVVDDLEKILSCPVATIAIGQCRYGFICNNEGGVIDDQILYRKSETEFFMVVNASTEEGDFAWITSQLSSGTAAKNISSQTGKIDLQGPLSAKICTKLLEKPIAGLNYYHFMHNRYRGEKILISRTGYTGELGFEFYASPDLACQFWDDCIAEGAEPAGLGARDTLRLEMGFPLYGHELDTTINAGWSGYSRALGAKKFIGSDSLDVSENGRKLSGILIEGRRTAHPGNLIVSAAGKEIGVVTSGSFSPSLNRAIALGYIDRAFIAAPGQLCIKTDRGDLSAQIAATPLYTLATGRNSIEQYL